MSNTKEELIRRQDTHEDSEILHRLDDIQEQIRLMTETITATLQQSRGARISSVGCRADIEQLREELLPMPKDAHTACGCADCQRNRERM